MGGGGREESSTRNYLEAYLCAKKVLLTRVFAPWKESLFQVFRDGEIFIGNK